MNSMSLKEKINKKKAVLGTWNVLACAQVADVLAQSGLDFVIMDLEHGAHNASEILNCANACRAHGSSLLVRVPKPDIALYQSALDQGAEGLIVPHIESASEADEFVKATSFAPQGFRGFSPYTPAAGYGGKEPRRYARDANSDLVRAVIIESKEGLDHLNEILEVKGLDVVYFGAYDLSAVFGHTGDIFHPKIVRLIRSAAKQVVAAGLCPGGFVARSVSDVRTQKKWGLKFITYGVDASVLARDYRNVVKEFRR